MLHYPPFDKEGREYENIKKVVEQYDIYACVYGHLHGKSKNYATEGYVNGTEFKLVSCDCVGFKPIKI